MLRQIVLVSGILVLSTAAALAQPAKIDPAAVKPGQLNLPLTVADDANTNWKGGTVTSGVPLPPGLVTDLARLRLVDAAGRPVPAQFAATERYWTRPDKSVRWLLVDFQTDVFEGESTTVYLRDDAAEPVPPPSPIKVEQTDAAITVTTGPLKFVVSKKAFNFIDAAWFDQNGDGQFTDDEQYIVSSPDNGSVITAAEWKEQGMAAGTKYTSAAAPPRKVAVEQAGPMRVTIVADGAHAPAGGGAAASQPDNPFYGYRVRITAYAGQPFIRVGYAITNTRAAEQLYVWPMAEAALVTTVKFDGEHVADFLGDNNQSINPPHYWEGRGQNSSWPGKSAMVAGRCSDAKVVCYQDSSGGDEWKDLRPNQHANRVFGGSKSVPGAQFRGWKAWRGDQEIMGGDRCPGLIDLRTVANAGKKGGQPAEAGKARGLIVVVRDFWQNYPKAFEAEKGRLAIKVFPSEAKRTFDLSPGTRKTHEFLMQFHGAQLFERHYDWLWRRANRPLMARAPVEWACRVEGAWDLGLANVASVPRSEFDKSVIDGCRVGWQNYGWISPWNPGGQHWNEATQFAPWLLRGDRRAFEEAEMTSRWAGDLVPWHYESDDLDRFWMLLRGWGKLYECKVTLNTPAGWKDPRGWIGYPDTGHEGMIMLLEHYRLTGDGFAREAVEAAGLHGRAIAYSSNYDCKKPFNISWCRKQDPDANPAYKNTNRYQAWPLFNFLSGYAINGDAQWLAEARTIALGYRNALRGNPVGYICDTVNAAGTTDTYGKDYKPELRANSASSAYANFQLALVTNALAKYYQEDRDEDVRDTILGSVDVLVNRALLRDGHGRPVGWSYCWGDLWGPNVSPEVAAGKAQPTGEWNPDVITAVGYGYRFSGRKDFLLPLTVGYEETKSSYQQFANGGYVPVAHPRADADPPAAITDLTANLAGGKVLLTWTAPAGEPVSYQVKYSPAEIVEQVTDWNGRMPNLPKAKDEYQKAAAEALKKKASFYQAFNVKGEPAPGKAGVAERFELTLPAGTYAFALKTLDAADNQSALSNLTKVTVP